ncbi:HNH endonuclease [Acetobacter orientalis]|uniref:HNH endonuclease n=1 Tax=Acetobacter orientalis TaxID=146474 RepID=UPI000662B161|nr:HNH endonuclease [Acetobacter orientalis]
MSIPRISSPVETLSGFLVCMCKEEVWRPIDEFQNYEVSSHGRVRRFGHSAALIPAWTHGYAHVSLCHQGSIKTRRVHRLVADAFLGFPPFVGAILAHNDGDKTNNRADNLRWASLAENQEDRRRHGTKTCGSAVKGAKLHEEDIPKIRVRLMRGETCADIADSYDVSISTISLIQRGKIWRHV